MTTERGSRSDGLAFCATFALARLASTPPPRLLFEKPRFGLKIHCLIASRTTSHRCIIVTPFRFAERDLEPRCKRRRALAQSATQVQLSEESNVRALFRVNSKT